MATVGDVKVSCIPTPFAVAMAEAADLYKNVNPEFYEPLDDHGRIEMFQSVAITGSFEEAIAAGYFGTELSEDQLGVLQAIHTLTGKWVVGKLSQTLMDRLDILVSLRDKGKDISDISNTIISLMGIRDEPESKQKSETQSTLLIKAADRQPQKKGKKKA